MAQSPSLRAIILDFNGVVADDETPHFRAYQLALREEGIELSPEDYYGRFLGMDERTCARALVAERGPGDHAARVDRILTRKAALFEQEIRARKPPLFPGVAAFVRRARERYALAIASGGRRSQIDAALADTPVRDAFTVIVSAEDVPTGKPDPAIYRIALSRLNAGRQAAVRPDECVVIEDSLAGIRSARLAGMRPVAVATTYPADRLGAAELVLPALEASTLERLEGLFGR